MGFFAPQLHMIMPTEWQRRDINAIMFGDNYILIAEDEEGNSFLDLNISNELLYEGLKSACKNDPSLLETLTDLVIDLHTEKK
jgi:phosphatidate phosphatase PAH1